MKRYYAIPVVIFVGVLLALCLTFEVYGLVPPACLLDLYDRKLQVPLFSGFLTISGFLLSLTIFIVVKMHEAVYQDAHYRHRIEQIKDIDPDYQADKPLQNLTTFLLISVVVALLTSFLQFTIGNWPNFYSVAVCISSAAASASFVLLSCVIIRTNIRFWIDYISTKPPEEK